jgi:hypothetical protein
LAIREMRRVVKRGGHVGFHDLCWKENTPPQLKCFLAEIEHVHPETLGEWKRLMEGTGLAEVVALDRSNLIPQWTKDFKRCLGIRGQWSATCSILKKWGLGGLLTIRESERIFRSKHMGYGLLVGEKS